VEARVSRRIALPLGALALLAAVALGLVARDVRRWQDAVRRDDVRFLVTPVEPHLWRGPGGPSGRVARSLLGIGDDLRFREAERLFVRGHVPASTFDREKARLGARGAAIARLDVVARSDPVAWRRVRASTHLGLLSFEDAQGEPDNGPALIRRALDLFVGAARANVGSDDAKYDLEVLLTLLRQQARQGREPGGERGEAGGGVGAGVTDVGVGY
jgi:hypothetical protein